MTTITVRKATQADKKGILHIISELHLHIPEFVWSSDTFVENQINKGEYFLTELNGEVAGIISLRRRNKKMYIETLAVAPKYRLQHIASQLVNFAKHLTKENGLKELCACSFFEYQIGDFYIKQGFKQLPEFGVYENQKYHIFLTKV